MIKDLRLSKILEKVDENDIVYIQDLVDELGVSDSTIRRDIKFLEKKNMLTILNGGAIKSTDEVEKSYDQKKIIHYDEKERIGKKAAENVFDGDIIYVDSGTTPLAMVKYITAKNVTIITSNPMIINHIDDTRGHRYILLGGAIEERLYSLVGVYTEKMLAEMYFDKSFIGTNGYVEGEYYYTFDERESRKKSLAIQNSAKAFVLADSSKKNQRALSKFAKFNNAQLITE